MTPEPARRDEPTVEPVFLLAPPRSGSTLLQRLLAAHPRVHTTAEPWILLPHLFSLGDEGLAARYDHALYAQARDDFARELPRGERDLHDATRAFAQELYRRATPEGRTHFLDKTPRYCMVADRLLDVFPEARPVVLYRNPLAIAASIWKHWDRAPRGFHFFRDDLVLGITRLVAAVEQHRDRCCVVRYESLVADPAPEIERVCSHLGLTFDPAMLDDASRRAFTGRMGDASANAGSKHIDRDRADAWPETFFNAYRRRWARRYLERLGETTLTKLGYDRAALLESLATSPRRQRRLLRDLRRAASQHVALSRRERVFARESARRT